MDTNKIEETKEKSKFPYMLIFTIVYLAMVILYCLLDVKGMRTLRPNEWGDFLAGFFAPLVFMWLIYGYHQQGKELSLQIEELSNSVAQQKSLAITAQQELDLLIDREKRQTELEIINAQPYFHVKDFEIKQLQTHGALFFIFSFNLKNSRNLCRSLFTMYSKDYVNNQLVWEGADFLPTDLEKGININFNIHSRYVIDEREDISVLYLKFFYTDAIDVIRIQILKITIDHNQILPQLNVPYAISWLHNKNFTDDPNYY